MGAKEKFEFNNWQIELERKAFRRSISIIIHPQKPIQVKAAVLTPKKAIFDFLLAKKDWIEKSLEKISRNQNKFPKRKFRDQEKFPFLGIDHPLKLVITLTKKPFISMTDHFILAHIPQNEWSAASLEQEHELLNEVRAFYKREAIRYLGRRVEYWAQQSGLHPKQVKFREQKTRWGSCTDKGIINLNWRLIVFPRDLIDYVIVHELAHLKHLDHSKRFWETVELMLPNYKIHAKKLKELQPLGDFLNTEI